MREILFSGQTDDGEWIFGFPLVYSEGSCIAIENDEWGVHHITVRPQTIGQYNNI